MEIKIRYVLKNKITNAISYKFYYLKQIEEGLTKLFDIDSYEIISKDVYTGYKDRKGKEIYNNDILSTEYSEKRRKEFFKNGDGRGDICEVYWIESKQQFGSTFYSKYGGEGYELLHEPRYRKLWKVIGTTHENSNLFKGEQ